MLTKEIENKLIKNHEANKDGARIDHKPIVKFFGGSSATWLITEYDKEENMFFGLCDLGLGFPETGYASREELESVRFPPFGLPIERDRYFKADKTLSEYEKEARKFQRINC